MMEPFDALALPSDVSDGGVELPSSVPSEGDSVDLPEGWPAGPCCRRKCLEKLADDAQAQAARLQLQERLSTVAGDARTAFHFEHIRTAAGPDLEGGKGLLFAQQYALCRIAYCAVTGCSQKVLTRCLAAAREGAGAPVDQRKRPLKREEPQAEHVDGFFMFCYMHLAEPLALGPDQEPEGEDVELPADVTGDLAEVPAAIRHLPEWLALQDPREDFMALATLCRQDFHRVERRWLPHMTPQQFYDLYVQWSNGEAASFSHWRRVLQAHWHKLLPMRAPKQHSRCSDCAVYAEMRRKAGHSLGEIAAAGWGGGCIVVGGEHHWGSAGGEARARFLVRRETTFSHALGILGPRLTPTLRSKQSALRTLGTSNKSLRTAGSGPASRR